MYSGDRTMRKMMIGNMGFSHFSAERIVGL
jgi:hypothetical protein